MSEEVTLLVNLMNITEIIRLIEENIPLGKHHYFQDTTLALDEKVTILISDIQDHKPKTLKKKEVYVEFADILYRYKYMEQYLDKNDGPYWACKVYYHPYQIPTIPKEELN